MTTGEQDSIPGQRAEGLRDIGARLQAAGRVVLTTHVNADADGTGSQAAVAAWLERAGIRCTIVNPTRFPANLRFLLHREDLVAELGSEEAGQAVGEADLLLVLDTSEPHRVAPLHEYFSRDRILVVDHHPAGRTVVGDLAVQDPTAAAAGELVYDLISLTRADWAPAIVQGIYVALVSDTGSFRFSNTTPRVHRLAAEMLTRGVDPEAIFQRLYGTVPQRRLELLREALSGLHVDPENGITWMVVPPEVEERLRTTVEDTEGLVDHARSVEGTRVAMVFRETPPGRTKISFRSTGDTDVNRLAREFGGGGHVKAAGAVVDAPLADSVPRVLDRVREVLRGR